MSTRPHPTTVFFSHLMIAFLYLLSKRMRETESYGIDKEGWVNSNLFLVIYIFFLEYADQY